MAKEIIGSIQNLASPSGQEICTWIRGSSLSHLNLSDNLLEEIPAELATLSSLEEFKFLDNALENYPQEFANFRYQGDGIYKKKLLFEV